MVAKIKEREQNKTCYKKAPGRFQLMVWVIYKWKTIEPCTL